MGWSYARGREFSGCGLLCMCIHYLVRLLENYRVRVPSIVYSISTVEEQQGKFSRLAEGVRLQRRAL